MMIANVFTKILYRLFAPRKKTKDQVDAIFRERAAEFKVEHGVTLDPFGSIVDAMKSIGLDPSLYARRDLWNEFRLEGLFEGTAEQNLRLMDELREQIALGDFAR